MRGDITKCYFYWTLSMYKRLNKTAIFERQGGWGQFSGTTLKQIFMTSLINGPLSLSTVESPDPKNRLPTPTPRWPPPTVGSPPAPPGLPTARTRRWILPRTTPLTASTRGQRSNLQVSNSSTVNNKWSNDTNSSWKSRVCEGAREVSVLRIVRLDLFTSCIQKSWRRGRGPTLPHPWLKKIRVTFSGLEIQTGWSKGHQLRRNFSFEHACISEPVPS